MKTATAILQRVLGFIFLAFGLNGFVNFIPQMRMPNPAMEFFVGLAATGYMIPFLFVTQSLAGSLLLMGLYVPLALAMLAPVVLNILLFHIFLAPAGLPVAFVVVALEAYLAWSYRDAFAPMLRASTPPSAAERANSASRPLAA